MPINISDVSGGPPIYFLIAQISWSVSFCETQNIALYSLYLCFHKPSHATAVLCFIPGRVRMGRAPCT